MATIADLMVTLGLDPSSLTEGVSNAQNSISSFVTSNAAQMRQLGVAMTGMGASLDASIGLTVAAAQSQKEAIAGLSITLKDAGVSYDSVKGSIDALIQSQVKTTSYSEVEQIDALQKLIIFTGNYDAAMAALPVALDLAAAAHIDLTSASKLVGDAMEGTSSRLKTMYGIDIPKGVTGMQALADIEAKVGGAAQATANPFTEMKNTVTEMAASIGTAVLPVIQSLINDILPIIDDIKKWVEAHQTLVKELLTFGLALGGVLTFLGPLLIMLPTLIASFTLLLGPIGLVVLAITALGIAAVELITHWTQVKSFFSDLWDYLQIGFAEAVKFIVDYVLLPWLDTWGKVIGGMVVGVGKLIGIFDHDLGTSIQNVGNEILNAKGTVDTWADGIENAAKTHKDLHDQEVATAAATKDATAAVTQQTTAVKDTTQAMVTEDDVAKSLAAGLTSDSTASTGLATAQTDLDKKIKSVSNTVASAGLALRNAEGDAGNFGITVDDVIKIEQSMGVTNNSITATLVNLGDQAGDANAVLQAFGLSGQNAALQLVALGLASSATGKIITDSMRAASAAMNAFKVASDAATAAQNTLNAAAASYPGGGVVVGNTTVSKVAVSQALAGMQSGMSIAQANAKYGNAAVTAALQGLPIAEQQLLMSQTGAAFTAAQQAANQATQAAGQAIANQAIAAAMANIPGLATGGEIRAYKPTLALFGEAGPETATFTPGVQGGAGMTVNNIFNNPNMREDADIDVIGEKIANSIRLRQGIRV